MKSRVSQFFIAIPSGAKGWRNVERYLKLAPSCWTGQKGCFSTSSTRVFAVLPYEARTIVAKSVRPIRRPLVENVEADGARGDAWAIVLTFFSCISIEQNLVASAVGRRRIESLMAIVQAF